MIKADTYNERFNAFKKEQSILMDEHTIYELDNENDRRPIKQAKYENLQLVQLIND